MRDIRISKAYLFAFIGLALLVFLLLLNLTTVMDFFIGPLAHSFWVIGRVFLSIDQSVYWLVLIAVVMVTAFRLLPLRPAQSSRYQYTGDLSSTNRVEYWRTLFGKPNNPTRASITRENLTRLLELLSQYDSETAVKLFSVQRRGIWKSKTEVHYASIEQILEYIEKSMENEQDDSKE